MDGSRQPFRNPAFLLMQLERAFNHVLVSKLGTRSQTRPVSRSSTPAYCMTIWNLSAAGRAWLQVGGEKYTLKIMGLLNGPIPSGFHVRIHHAPWPAASVTVKVMKQVLSPPAHLACSAVYSTSSVEVVASVTSR